MALMIVTDRLMIGDCYRNSASQAWFVSSLAGGVFGLMFTASAWVAAVVFGQAESLVDLLAIAIEHFFAGAASRCVRLERFLCRHYCIIFDARPRKCIRRLNWCGVRMLASNLPTTNTEPKTVATEIVSITAAIAGTSLALYMTPIAFR